MPASANSRAISGAKQRVGDDGVDGRRAGGRERLGAGDQGAARRDDIVDQQNRPAGEQCRLGKADFDRAIAAARFLRHRMREPEPAGEIAHPGPRLRVGTDHDRRGIDPGCAQRAPRWPAWPTGCRPRCRETPSACRSVRCRWASTVITRSTIAGEQPADRLLADRFALVKGGVLAHVAEIRREQHEPLRPARRSASAANRMRKQLVVGLVERGIDDGGRCSRADRHAHFPVGKTVQRDFVQLEGQAARPAVWRRSRRMAGSECAACSRRRRAAQARSGRRST